MPSLRSTRTTQERKTRASSGTPKAERLNGKQSGEDLDEEEVEEDWDEEREQVVEDGEEGEDEEEEEAETRCICGETDPPDENGLFIQCEKCSVWQHGFCVSISDNVPEKYWCEKCKPELHSIIIRPDGKRSKYLPVQPKESSNRSRKSRKTSSNSGPNTSQNASTPTVKDYHSSNNDNENENDHDIHSHNSHDPNQSTIHPDDDYESPRRRKERSTFNSSADSRYDALIQRVMEESKKDAHTDSNSEGETEDNDVKLKSKSKSKAKSKSKSGSAEPIIDNEDEDSNGIKQETETTTTRPSSSSSNINNKAQDLDSESNNDSTASRSYKNPRKSNKRSKKLTNGDSNTNTNQSPTKDNSSIDFNKPTKPRLPQQRTTLNEMRKRVAAILEYIGRTQVEIATEQKDSNELTKFIEDDSTKLNVEKLFEKYNGSLELMDGLTRKLLIWEEQFGKYGD